MTPPLVTVGLPVYNAEKTLSAVVESLLDQQMEDFEVIISDNASEDDTEKVGRELAASDSRVRYYRNAENLGAWRNFDRTFELGSGRYFKWASDDDRFDPSLLGKSVAVLEEDPDISLCTWLERMVDSEGVERRSYALEERWLVDADDPYGRFIQFLDAESRGSRGDPIYGLMRRETAARTRLLKAGLWIPNFIMMGELAVLGPWATIPEVLVDRGYPSGPARWGRELSVRSVIRHFDPANGEDLWPHWKFMGQYFSIVHRSDMNATEKLGLYPRILAHFASRWRGLAYDVSEALGYLVGRSRSNT